MCWYYHRCLGRQHVGQVLRRRMFRSVPVCYLKGQLVVRRQGSPGEGAGLQNSREHEMRAMSWCHHRCPGRQRACQVLRRRKFRSVPVRYLKSQFVVRYQDPLGEKTEFRNPRGGLETGAERSGWAAVGLYVQAVPLQRMKKLVSRRSLPVVPHML